MAATTTASFSGVSLRPPYSRQSNRSGLFSQSLSFTAKRNSLKSLLLKRSGFGYEKISRTQRSFIVRCDASSTGKVSSLVLFWDLHYE